MVRVPGGRCCPPGRIGRFEPGRIGRFEPGRIGRFEPGRIGRFEPGRIGFELGRIGRFEPGKRVPHRSERGLRLVGLLAGPRCPLPCRGQLLLDR